MTWVESLAFLRWILFLLIFTVYEMSVEVDFVEVVKIIQQFLAENNLKKSLRALQEETNVIDNVVEDLEAFKADIISGRWDHTLKATLNLRISDSRLADLYEQIAIEIIEMREIAVARAFIRETDPFVYLKEHHPDRYIHLEHLLTLTYFDSNELIGNNVREAYPNKTSKEKRRRALAQSLLKEITAAPPSRLLTLISQAIRWQKLHTPTEEGSTYDIIKGVFAVPKAESDIPVVESYARIKFPKSQCAQCAKFSPCGKYFVTGTMDGFIEVWNYMTGKLRKDLAYQAKDNMMLMESSVCSLTFSKDGKYLATGDKLGKIKIWRMSTGECVMRLLSAHSQGITSLCFNPEGTELVSGSFDSNVSLYGLKSGRALRNFIGHKSYVNDVLFCPYGKNLISVSSDGCTKIWDSSTSECISTLLLQDGAIAVPGNPCKSVIQVILNPLAHDQYYIVDKSEYIYLMSETGKLLNSYKLSASRKDTNGEQVDLLAQGNVSTTISPNGDLIYCAREDNFVYTFNTSTRTQVGYFKVSEANTIEITHHTSSNILATLSLDGFVRLWKS